jgi:hypothetical protein
MKPEIKTLWCEALRSGKYKQCEGQLKDGDKYCCLGVLTDLFVKDGQVVPKGWPLMGSLPVEVVSWAGLEDADPDHLDPDEPESSRFYIPLSGDNDSGKSFAEIADLIEKYL